MSKHILSPQKLSNIRVSSHVTLSTLRRFLSKEKHCVCWELTQSKKSSSQWNEIFNPVYAIEASYPLEFIESILTDIDFSWRKAALQTKPKTSKNLLPFVTTHNPATPNLKKILMKHWHLITDNPKLATTFPNTPIVAYKKKKSLKDFLVRAKIPSIE